MKQKKDIGQRVSLYEMLTDEKNYIHKILIPKIQRDYAQGRDECASVRKRFLTSIFNVIDNDTQVELLLDFIFGNKKYIQEKNVFEPVDGQQRLTTLFLLHLYIGKRAGVDTEILRKFSYETRDSSKQFCTRLNDINQEHFKNIREYIEDQWWFTGLWKTDPTIKSMINMLDDINKHYNDLNSSEPDFRDIWERLKHKVVFWRLYLSDLSTTDDLYIKMNSRGLPLTEFEHFKAMLEEYTDTKGEISQKIDTVWTELLWNYRNKNQDLDSDSYMDNGLDKCFYNLLLFYLNIEGTKNGDTSYSKLETDILVLAEKALGGNVDKAKKAMSRFSLILDFFSTKDSNGKFINNPNDFFGKFIQTEYEVWPGGYNSTPKVFIKESNNCDLLKDICTSEKKIELKATLYTEAFFQYAFLLKSKNPECPSESEFLNRLRIIRNLVENTELHAAEFQDNLLLIDEIVSTGNLEKEGIKDEFNKSQKIQEGVKNEWMLQNPSKEYLLKRLENHWLLMGNLNMVIDRNSGIDDIAAERFGMLFHNECDYYLEIQRAILTVGDYSYCTKTIKPYGGGAWTRWKDFTQSHNNDTTPRILQEFLNKYDDYSEASLQNIYLTYLQNSEEYPWEYYLIKYDAIYNALRSKYRYKEGTKYTYLKLNANGGGRSEYFWNPYNVALESRLKGRVKESFTDYYGGPLTIDGKIKIDIDENHVYIYTTEEEKKGEKIPQNSLGIDTVDRIEFAKTKYMEYLSSNLCETATDEQTE